MIHVEPNSYNLLLRYNNYKKTDFIQEHLACLKSTDHVWILKTGKQLPQAKIKMVLDNGGVVILRAPQSAGGKYYLAHIVESFNGDPSPDMEFPEYYYDMLDDENLWTVESVSGTWFKVDQIEDMPEEAIIHLRLISNGKLADEVIKTTRSATMYVSRDIAFSGIEIK